MNILHSIHEKKGNVLFVQVDHLSGEMVGTAIEDLYEAGASNVQVIPTVTKKNRPGYLFFVDTCEQYSAVEKVIIELGATGWHVLETAHRHIITETQSVDVTLETPEGLLNFTVQVKSTKGHPKRMQPEHSSCLTLREALRKKGVYMPLKDLYAQIIKQI